MATVLDKTLKRELMIDGRAFMLTLSPTGLLLTVKGRRKGVEIEWTSLVNGEAAMATALNASLRSNLDKPASGEPVARRLPSVPGKANGRTGTPSKK